MEQLRETFSRLQLFGYKMEIYEFNLVIPYSGSELTIPSDLMGMNNRAGIVKITCPSANYQLKFDKNSFRSSADKMFYLGINNCDLTLVDWSFLDGFTKMTLLAISNSKIKIPDDFISSLSPDLVPSMTIDINGKTIANVFD